MYIRQEMYPGLPEEVIQKLHHPEDGIPNSAYLEDLPMFPNPFDHSGDADTELDPAKIRTKPYDFGNASVILTTRDAVVPTTWEDEKLGPPRENRRVRLQVRVKDIGLPILAAQKLVLLCGPRYNFNNDVLTLTSDRYEEAERSLSHGLAGEPRGRGEEADGGEGAASQIACEARQVPALQQGYAGHGHGEEAVRGYDHGG